MSDIKRMEVVKIDGKEYVMQGQTHAKTGKHGSAKVMLELID